MLLSVSMLSLLGVLTFQSSAMAMSIAKREIPPIFGFGVVSPSFSTFLAENLWNDDAAYNYGIFEERSRRGINDIADDYPEDAELASSSVDYEQAQLPEMNKQLPQESQAHTKSKRNIVGGFPGYGMNTFSQQGGFGTAGSFNPYSSLASGYANGAGYYNQGYPGNAFGPSFGNQNYYGNQQMWRSYNAPNSFSNYPGYLSANYHIPSFQQFNAQPYGYGNLGGVYGQQGLNNHYYPSQTASYRSPIYDSQMFHYGHHGQFAHGIASQQTSFMPSFGFGNNYGGYGGHFGHHMQQSFGK